MEYHGPESRDLNWREDGFVDANNDGEADANSVDVNRVRVQNTSFFTGGTSLDVDFWALEGTGPDIRDLTFVNSTNSLNGLFVNIPSSNQFGVPVLPEVNWTLAVDSGHGPSQRSSVSW